MERWEEGTVGSGRCVCKKEKLNKSIPMHQPSMIDNTTCENALSEACTK